MLTPNRRNVLLAALILPSLLTAGAANASFAATLSNPHTVATTSPFLPHLLTVQLPTVNTQTISTGILKIGTGAILIIPKPEDPSAPSLQQIKDGPLTNPVYSNPIPTTTSPPLIITGGITSIPPALTTTTSTDTPAGGTLVINSGTISSGTISLKAGPISVAPPPSSIKNAPIPIISIGGVTPDITKERLIINDTAVNFAANITQITMESLDGTSPEGAMSFYITPPDSVISAIEDAAADGRLSIVTDATATDNAFTYNPADLTALLNKWQAAGASTTSLSLAPAFRASTGAPEPTSLALLTLSAPLLLRRRKR